MAFLKKIKKDKSIIEISLADHNDNFEQTLLYKISTYDGLNWFKNVIFAGSLQDHYCPYYSAHCEQIPVKSENDKLSKVICKMAKNIGSKLNEVKTTKLTFLYDNIKGVEKILGRVPHIQILDNPIVMLQIIILYKKYFI